MYELTLDCRCVIRRKKINQSGNYLCPTHRIMCTGREPAIEAGRERCLLRFSGRLPDGRLEFEGEIWAEVMIDGKSYKVGDTVTVTFDDPRGIPPSDGLLPAGNGEISALRKDQ